MHSLRYYSIALKPAVLGSEWSVFRVRIKFLNRDSTTEYYATDVLSEAH